MVRDERRRRARRVKRWAVLVLAACGRPATPPAVAPPPAPVAQPEAAPVAVVAPAPAPSAEKAKRLTVGEGCSGKAKAGDAAPATRCTVSGNHAFLFHVVVPVAEGEFLEIGLYGGAAAIDVPGAEGDEARVTIRTPLEVTGTMSYEPWNASLVHRQGGAIHPLLTVAPGATVYGSASGEAFAASVPVSGDLVIGPVELACSALELSDRNAYDENRPAPRPATAPAGPRLRPDPADPERIAKLPATGILRASWDRSLLVKSAVDADDGLRLSSRFFGSLLGEVLMEVTERRADHLKIRLRGPRATLVGYVAEKDVRAEGPDEGGGRGEGIGLCGCGRGHSEYGHTTVMLAAGTPVHTRPDGKAWATVPAPTKASVDATETTPGWRQVHHVPGLSEGGDSCDSEKLEHAWVRSSAVQPLPPAPPPRKVHPFRVKK